jgi:MFS family permease
MSTSELGHAPVARQRISLVRHFALGSYWLGTYFVITPVYTILLQVQVSQAVDRGIEGTAVGLATGVGGFFALILPPLIGHWSDGLRTPWGRRKPIMVAGSLGIVLALAVLGTATSYPLIFVGFVLVVATVNIAGAAYVATIPDLVDKAETGRASGFLGFYVQLGSVLSLVTLLIASKAHHLKLTYVVIVIVLILTLVPSLWAMGREPDVQSAETEGPFRRRAVEFLRPIWTGDFGWAVFTRFLNTSAFYTILPFLLFAFRDLEGVKEPDQFTALFELLVTAAAIPVALICGSLSDRYGRKRFVYASGALSSLVLLAFMTGALPQPLILALGLVYGVGYGAYTAVDWALALDTLPSRDRPAKDMGLFHVADALPRVSVAFAAGLVLDYFNHLAPLAGYRALFVMAMVLYVGGAVLVSQIKSVR